MKTKSYFWDIFIKFLYVCVYYFINILFYYFLLFNSRFTSKRVAKLGHNQCSHLFNLVFDTTVLISVSAWILIHLQMFFAIFYRHSTEILQMFWQNSRIPLNPKLFHYIFLICNGVARKFKAAQWRTEGVLI